MAWDKLKPENDQLLINFPSSCRQNWDALELGTNANLLITNAKISASAGIVDTKLAQITTASKVSGAALTLLVNIPGGAGLIPVANIPNLSTDKITSGTLAVVRGGTGLAALGSAYYALAVNSGASALEFVELVRLAGDQTIAGVKTFGSFPITPSSAPTTDYQVANKKYVDDNTPVDTTGFQLFTASGTWTKPAGITKVMVTMCGGGGGGGGNWNSESSMGGGGGGAYLIRAVVDVSDNVTVIVGAGGAGGSSGGGDAGGVSSFGALSVNRGAGGSIGAGGAGGVAPNTTVSTTGSTGGLRGYMGAAGGNGYGAAGVSGGGGGSYGGVGGDRGNGAPGSNGTGYGSGGGGAGGSGTFAGGAGKGGFVLVQW